MNTKAIIAIAIVAVVVVAGAAYFVVSNDSGSDDHGEAKVVDDCHLWIYGNVNGDDYIDQKDIDLLQKIIDGKAEETYVIAYDGYSASGVSQKISLADANGDGNLNSADIDYIKKTISYMQRYSNAVNGNTLDSFNEKFVLYYNNCDNKTCSVNLPIKSLVSMYFSNSEIVRLLGAVDRVVGTDDTTLNKPTLLPEFQNIPNIGDRKNISVESVLATHADAYFTGSASTYAGYLEEGVGESMDIIRLSAWEDNNVMVGALTLGYMLGCTDSAYEYIDWCNKYIDLIAERTEKVTDKITVITPKGRVNDQPTLLEGNGPGSGQFEINELAGCNDLTDLIAGATSEYPNYTQEWALTANPDAIVISGYCGWEHTNDNIQKRIYDVIDKVKYTYTGTSAVSDGKIYFIGNELYTGPCNIIAMVYVASWLYPDEMHGIDGLTVFKEFIDKFCPGLSSYDLDANINHFVFGPDSVRA